MKYSNIMLLYHYQSAVDSTWWLILGETYGAKSKRVLVEQETNVYYTAYNVSDSSK